MAAFLSWYIIITLLGWLTFPLVYALFPALADRGYSLARAAGLLLWGYVFWLLISLDLMQNNTGGVLFALLVVSGLSASSFFFLGSKFEIRKTEILRWIRSNLRLIISVEVLFLLAFAFLAFVRAGNPQLDNAEKPMELMFINSILRSPTFPPHDSWLSGYAISYYYFGYVMAAMLAMLTGLTGSVAHNLMTSLVFGLAAIGSYGILYNLLAARDPRAENRELPVPIPDGESLVLDNEAPITNDQPRLRNPDSRFTFAAFLAPLFLLLVSNLEGFLEVLHRAGIFWSDTQNFWTWLGIKELNEAPAQPLAWIPDRFWWWWRASRVISDYDLAGNFREVIDEFPFFSFLHADLHPHVLAIPFNLLAFAVALNLVLGGWRGETRLFGLRLRIRKSGFFAAALLLGGLAFLNTWDILIAAALIIFSYVLFQVHEDRWSWSRFEDVFAVGLPLGVLAVLLYLPFYFGFSSQAGGILPNLTSPTRGAQLWVMFAPMFVPLFAYLLYLWRGKHSKANWALSLVLVGGLVILLWALSWAIGWLAFIKDPAFAQQYLASQGMPDTAAFFAAAMSRRLLYIGGLLTMLAVLIPALAFLLRRPQLTDDAVNAESEERIPDERGPLGTFLLLLIVLGGLLVLVPEFVYLRDVFGYRINTIFKFYYQAWLLWSIAAAYAVAVLLRELNRRWGTIFLGALVILLATSLTYPALSLPNKTNNFKPAIGLTLDDFTRIQLNNPDEAAAMLWLKSAPDGVLAEAVPDGGGSYTGFARISEYTGLPAVLGWAGHEEQWRGSYSPQGTRSDDIAALYSTPKWDTARDIIRKYHIKYVYVGDLERTTYAVQEEKFQKNLVQVFQKGNVVIYEAP
jgi:YYY domain-containing protein